jgi:hypothetical protein
VVTSNLEHPAVLLVIKELERKGFIDVSYLNDAIVRPEAVVNAM